MFTMGSDFQFENAVVNYKNMDKLIKYTNALASIVSVRYCKFNALYEFAGCDLSKK
jgi:lysosomal alpha-mannosidase